MLKKTTIILPFFLLAGIALQGLGFYLLALFIPAYFFSKKINPNYECPKELISLGYFLCLLFLIFPLSNIINNFMPPGSLIIKVFEQKNLSLGQLLKGHLSFSILGLGLFLILFSLLINKKNTFSSSAFKHLSEEEVFSYFTKGLLYASLIYFAFILVQTSTGIDLRLQAQPIGRHDLMSQSFYRVCGFFGHQLTLASVSLALFTFYWTALCSFSSTRERKESLSFFFIALIHLIAVLLSGGRTALFVACFLLVAIPCYFLLNKKENSKQLKKMFYGFLALLSSSFCILYFFEISGRFLGFLQNPGQIFTSNRWIFWQVHWTMFLEKPFFGHGHAWLSKAGQRNLYYDVLGHESLNEKYNAHNIFLEIISHTGIFGTLFITVSFLMIITNLASFLGKKNILFQCLLMSLVANIMHGFTQNTFFDSSLIYIYLALMIIVIWDKLFKHSSLLKKKTP